MHKTWNVRDQTEEGLRLEAERLYKQIEIGFKMIKKISSSEDAKKHHGTGRRDKIHELYAH